MRPRSPCRERDRLLGVDDEVQHHLLELGEDRKRGLRRLLVDVEADALLSKRRCRSSIDRRDDVAQVDGARASIPAGG